jgi:hypothetical protein
MGIEQVGLRVERQIPMDVVGRLMIGEYKLHGGVIRGAQGTPMAGQIVRHLVPFAPSVLSGLADGSIDVSSPSALEDLTSTLTSSFLNSEVNALGSQVNLMGQKIDVLSMATKQLLKVASASMGIAGLNLVASAVSFAVLSKKIDRLEARLNRIYREVTAIRELLERKEQSRLRAALTDLSRLPESGDNRRTILHDVRRILTEMNQYYRISLSMADDYRVGLATQEYYMLVGLFQVRCTGELGMYKNAYEELSEIVEFSRAQSQRITRDYLLNPNPERFLGGDFAELVSAQALAEWLDFAYGEEKNFAQIDELRKKSRRWYTGSFPSPFNPFSDHIKREREEVIPAISRLVKQDSILEGYRSQYQFFQEKGVRPSEFDEFIKALDRDLAVDDYLILEPVAANT